MEFVNYTNAGAASSFCVPGASDMHQFYLKIHGYVAVIICALGSAANSINIAVLSRREMATSTNSILTGLAVADLLVMLEYLPFAMHVYIQTGSRVNDNSYGWAVFVYFHSIFSQIFHTISIWLTIVLAVWRYIAIAYPQNNRNICSKNNTTIAIASAYVTCPFICLPIYFAMHIEPFQSTNNINNDTAREDVTYLYRVQMAGNHHLLTGIFWMYSVILKLIPCIALSILSACLISKLATTEKRRQKLLKKSKTHIIQSGAGREGGEGGAGRTDRTTRMLLALLGLFLLTEVPQGSLGLLSAMAPHFFENCYIMFGEVMDILALLSSAVNFGIYCSMSRQFRGTFARLAGAACRAHARTPRPLPVTQSAIAVLL